MDLTKHANKIPKPPTIAIGKYRHYKGKEYEIIGVAMHTETLEPFIVYRPLYEKPGAEFWVRPYDMFNESVKVDGKIIPRFEKVDE